MATAPDDRNGYGRGEMVRAVPLPELTFDVGEGQPAPVGYGVGEPVRAVPLPPVEFDSLPGFTPRPVLRMRPPEHARLKELAGSFAAALADVPPENRRSALAAFIGQARNQIATYDSAVAALMGGFPGVR